MRQTRQPQRARARSDTLEPSGRRAGTRVDRGRCPMIEGPRPLVPGAHAHLWALAGREVPPATEDRAEADDGEAACSGDRDAAPPLHRLTRQSRCLLVANLAHLVSLLDVDGVEQLRVETVINERPWSGTRPDRKPTRLRPGPCERTLGDVQRGRRHDEWESADLEEQRRRLRTLSIEERLQEVLAWSAALLADDVAAAGARALATSPDPVGLGSRRP